MKKSKLSEQLHLLHSITNSHAHDKSSIIEDAANSIKELKHKIEVLNKDIETAQSSINSNQNSGHKVKVKTLESGFLVNVKSGKSSQGMLVSILEAFEEMGLNILEARVSCEDMFLFEAVGQESEENERLNAHYVQQMVSDSIENWSEDNDHEQ